MSLRLVTFDWRDGETRRSSERAAPTYEWEDMGLCWSGTPGQLDKAEVEWCWTSDATEEDMARAVAYYSDEYGDPALLVLDWG